MTLLCDFDIINYTKNRESSMKITSLVPTSNNQKIRDNRLRMKQNLKLKFSQHQQKNISNDITEIETNQPNKTETHVLLLNRVGLVEKEYIQGQFSDSYELKEKVGEGAHATVYKCVQKSTGKIFAVKITKQGDEELIEGAKVQYKILKSLDHPGVMKAQAFYTDRVKMTTYLVCELCNYSQLGLYFRNCKNKFLPEAQATSIIATVLQTLQYLHKKGVCHRDIKPENILYDPKSKSIKVIDFDCAKNKRQSESKFEMWTKTGSLHYQAPEYFSSTIYDQKVDLWAVGVIAYELVTGELPFKTFYYTRMIKMITEETIQIDKLTVSEDYKILLKKLLQKEPSKRFSAACCLRLPLLLKNEQVHSLKWFDDFDVELTSTAHSSPRSCTDLPMRSSETSTCGWKSPIPLLKFFCFVDDL